MAAPVRQEGAAGLLDRSSRPRSSPSRTSADREVLVLDERARSRQGPQRISAATGVPARTVSRILARHRIPRLDWCDPVTGELIRASRATAARYERERPGELVHVDVKKLGRIPDGGGWRAHGRSEEGSAAAASASTTCTPPSTTVPGSPTQRSIPMNAA
jgi:hypothetical protein